MRGYRRDFGLRNRIPGIFWRTDLDMDQMGGLMAYGANRAEQSRRAAYFVDKILKGAKPAELPVELTEKVSSWSSILKQQKKSASPSRPCARLG